MHILGFIQISQNDMILLHWIGHNIALIWCLCVVDTFICSVVREVWKKYTKIVVSLGSNG